MDKVVKDENNEIVLDIPFCPCFNPSQRRKGMEHLFVIAWRGGPKGSWKPLADGILGNRPDAEFVIKAEKIKGTTLEYTIIEGTTLPDNDELTESF